METIAEKISKAQQLFGTDSNLTASLHQHMQSKNYTAFSHEFSTAAQGKGIDLSAEDVSSHFGFQESTSTQQQIKEAVKEEVKGAAQDEATGRVEDELSNQLGVDVSGVGDAAGGLLDTIKGWFGGKKKK